MLIVAGGVALFFAINVIYPLSVSFLPLVIGAWGFSMLVQGLTSWLPVSIKLRDGTLLLILSDLTLPSVGLVITILWRYYLVSHDFFWGALMTGVLWLKKDKLWLDVRGVFQGKRLKRPERMGAASD
jgi:hypothetical protein